MYTGVVICLVRHNACHVCLFLAIFLALCRAPRHRAPELQRPVPIPMPAFGGSLIAMNVAQAKYGALMLAAHASSYDHVAIFHNMP